MMDFLPNDLIVRATTAQRNREALAIARLGEARQTPRTVRAALATRLMCLASHLDRQVVRALAQRELRAAGR